MPIQKDQGPNRRPRTAGRLPDPEPQLGHLLAQAWQREYLAGGEDFLPSLDSQSVWRHSWAGSCARAMQYKMRRHAALRAVLSDPDNFTCDVSEMGPLERIEALKPEPLEIVIAHQRTEALTIASHWTFGLGEMVHRLLQDRVKEVFPGTEAELRVTTLGPSGGAGNLDLVVTTVHDEARHYSDGDSIAADVPFVQAVEIKTINGFGFKRMIGDRGTAEGPRSTSVVQLALNAQAVKADEALLVVVSLECLSPAVYATLMNKLGRTERAGEEEWRRFLAEYRMDRAEYTAIADAENRRVARISELDAEGKLVPRVMPDPNLPVGHRITNPANGTWQVKDSEGRIVESNSTWQCQYCENRSRCLEDGPS